MEVIGSILTTIIVILMTVVCIAGFLMATTGTEGYSEIYIDDDNDAPADPDDGELVGVMDESCPGCGSTYSDQDYEYQICQSCGLINGSTRYKSKLEG